MSLESVAAAALAAAPGEWREITVALADEFDWVPPVVIARLVRRSALTLALTTGQNPEHDDVLHEARERLLRATMAILGAVNADAEQLDGP